VFVTLVADRAYHVVRNITRASQTYCCMDKMPCLLRLSILRCHRESGIRGVAGTEKSAIAHTAERVHGEQNRLTAIQLLLSRTGEVKNYGRLLEQGCGADAGMASPVFNQISIALEKGPSSSPPTVS
jgi:hypothetical protein